MRKRFVAILFLIVLILFAHRTTAKRSFPPQLSYVNDYANLLSVESKAQLETVLKDFAEKTTHEVLIATFPTLGDEHIESFMADLADEWKIGYKDLANGVIIALFQKEYQAAIETGLGLDDRLPLTFRRNLIQNQLAPFFRKGDYDNGAWSAIRALIHKIDPSYQLPRQSRKKKPMKSLLAGLILLVGTLSMLLDMASYFAFQRSMQKTRGYAYWREIGRYSFLEWWLLYGTVPIVVEYIYFHFLRRWVNPGFVITSSGTKTDLFHFRTGRGRFFGNGNFGKW